MEELARKIVDALGSAPHGAWLFDYDFTEGDVEEKAFNVILEVLKVETKLP